jgi:hypothetical protein
VWNWPGDAEHPSHDEYLREFLAASRSRGAEMWVTMPVVIVGAVILIVMASYVARARIRMHGN